MTRTTLVWCVSWIGVLSGCSDPNKPPEGEPPILDPEPAGAPSEVADGRLSCLGNNTPPPPSSSTLELTGYVRAFADPTNETESQPEAELTVFDEHGTELESGFSDPSTGRAAITVPAPDGFLGTARVSVDGYVDFILGTSRAKTDTTVNAWVWMLTPDELGTVAGEAGVVIEPGKGIVVGSVHDCDVFGVANAVPRVGGETAGFVFFEGAEPDDDASNDFTPAPERTFTGANGRFALVNVEPGPVTVEAFGRIEAGGALVLLSLADITVAAGAITAVDLQPRVGVNR